MNPLYLRTLRLLFGPLFLSRSITVLFDSLPAAPRPTLHAWPDALSLAWHGPLRTTDSRSRGDLLTFLLSPANLGGVRGKLLLSGKGQFPLARRLHEGGAPLGDVFAFVSGLYFRGKLTYATTFVGAVADRVRIITSNRGLVAPDTMVTAADLAAFGACDLDPADPRYAEPLRRDLASLADGPVVLLGSLATGKYLEILVAVLGERLVAPASFVGLGDMSRGSLLLQAARAGRELAYCPAAPLWNGRPSLRRRRPA